MDASVKDILKMQENKRCIIGVGQYYDLLTGTNSLSKRQNKISVKGSVEYQSNGSTYESKFEIDIENYMTFFSVETDEETLLKILKEQKNQIKSLNKQIIKLNEIIENRNTY